MSPTPTTTTTTPAHATAAEAVDQAVQGRLTRGHCRCRKARLRCGLSEYGRFKPQTYINLALARSKGGWDGQGNRQGDARVRRDRRDRSRNRHYGSRSRTVRGARASDGQPRDDGLA